ncbi:MAG: glycerophosphodiester phosphodiesterase [Rhodobacteraceae bacterium]|nr:glycerophosphodiester phosphodiesterase [Paracoccaceae bacterium]
MATRVALVLLVLIGLLWLGNSSRLVTGLADHQTRLIAHRGVHQIYTGTDRSTTSCQASPIAPSDHGLIENTIPSMRAAFAFGADVVELDVHLTSDNVFAVFHDWTLDCKTDGTGVTHEQSFAELRRLDVGYRYDTGDQSFPLRGTGLGALPSLDAVLAADLPGQYLINFKSRRASDGRALATRIADTPDRARIFGVYGGHPPTQKAQELLPGLRGFDRPSLKACALRYALMGWSGYVPQACRNTLLAVPRDLAPYLWGWPHRLTRRLGAVGSDVILLGPNDGSGFTTGIDSIAAARAVPAHFDGYVWTNRIDIIGPVFRP